MKAVIRLWMVALLLGHLVALQAQTWTQKADFGGGDRQYSSYLAINGKGYIGFGNNVQQNDWWEYDPAANTWTQKASIPNSGGRAEMACFTIGNKGYVGLGLGDNGTENYWWEYEPTTDTWTPIAPFPGIWPRLPVAFSIGTKGYVGSGSTTQGVSLEFWEYESTNNTWTQKADMPDGAKRYAGSAFAIGNKGYVGLGIDNGSNPTKTFWEYDPATDSWTQKADVGGGVRVNAIGFASTSKGYMGMGFDNAGTAYSDLWEYEPTTDTWTEMPAYPGGGRFAGAGFAIDCKAYVGVGTDGAFAMHQDFYELNAQCAALPLAVNIAPTSATCHGVADGRATANPTGGTGPYTYAWQPGGQTSQAITGLAAGNYSVIVTDNTLATVSGTVTIGQPQPVPVTVSADTTICSGSTVQLTATGADTYTWGPSATLNIATGNTVLATPGTSVTYLATGTLAGCTGTDSVRVTINSLPVPGISTSSTIICSGDSAEVCVPGGYTAYLWSTGSTATCINVKNAGNYWVTVTGQNGCSAVSERQPLAVYPVPSVSIIVQGDTLTSFGAVAYQWIRNGNVIDGATSPVYVAPQGGQYAVQITDANGCVTTSEPVAVATGIGETEFANSIIVYPNPSSEQVMIYNKGGNQLSDIRIVNMLGQEVRWEPVDIGEEMVRINVAELPAGIFRLMLYSSNRLIGSKVMVHQF